MIALTLQEIADITGGRLDCVPDPAATVTGFVEFDSRKVTPGGLFLALPGARVDGHDFAEKAVESGAVAVLAARPVGVPAIVVEPTGKVEGDGANADIYANDEDGSAAAVIQALSALARAVTQRLAAEDGLNIVGVTGSAGKTSTKDLIATIFRAAGETVAPPGSFNNEVGLPYTALRCDEHTEYLVAEMSARGIGHIRHLTGITAPKVGVVLNVGTAHLGEFGSRENIALAKGELVERSHLQLRAASPCSMQTILSSLAWRPARMQRWSITRPSPSKAPLRQRSTMPRTCSLTTSPVLPSSCILQVMRHFR